MDTLLYAWAAIAKIVLGVCVVGLFWSFVRYRDWEAARILFIPFYGFGHSLFVMGRVFIPIVSFGRLTVQEEIKEKSQFSCSKNGSKTIILGSGWGELFGLILFVAIIVLACTVFI